MTNPAIIAAAFNTVQFTRTNQTVQDFNNMLPPLRGHFGDLERHEDGNSIWVTPWDNPEFTVLEFIKSEKEINRYY